jgi:hypothetical protein
MEKMQRISSVFQGKDVLWGFAQPPGHPPHCDNAVLPNLLNIPNFFNRGLIYLEYQTYEKVWWRQMMNHQK